jgi:hypothetical protein
MSKATKDDCAVARNDEDLFVDLDEEIDGDLDSWRFRYFARRKDAFKAIRAADRLGINCSLSRDSAPRPDGTQTHLWVVILQTTADYVPAGASTTVPGAE